MGEVRHTTVNGVILGEGGGSKTYVPDGLGSAVSLEDSTGALTDTFRYWPYGEERVRTGTTGTPFRFIGTRGYYRDGSDRTYVGARTFRPAAARWSTLDPVRSALSSFVYGDCTPLTARDPSGLAPSEPKKRPCYTAGQCDQRRRECDIQAASPSGKDRSYWERTCEFDYVKPYIGPRDCGCCTKGETIEPCPGYSKKRRKGFVCGGGSGLPGDPPMKGCDDLCKGLAPGLKQICMVLRLASRVKL
jgi:RHS repeat-associated protein